MSSFDQALAFVLDALTRRQASGGPAPTASLEALEHLAAATAEHRDPAPTPPAPPRGLTGLAAQARAAIGASPKPEEPPPAEGLSREERMEALRLRVAECVKCPALAGSRSQTVFGVGNVHAELMFVGEAPGADEDRAGEPFVGRAGQLLTKIIEAMGFKRGEVYIANVLKCRPDMPPGESGNRKPTPEEMATCLPYLIEQIEIIRPKCLVALGSTAMEGLTGTKAPMHALRGRWHAFRGIPLMATYHPAYLLRNPSNAEKRKVWEDMLQVLELLGKTITPKQRGYFLDKR